MTFGSSFTLAASGLTRVPNWAQVIKQVKLAKRAGGVAHVIELLPSKLKSLSSNPQTNPEICRTVWLNLCNLIGSSLSIEETLPCSLSMRLVASSSASLKGGFCYWSKSKSCFCGVDC
jgi:hypothetical protein